MKAQPEFPTPSGADDDHGTPVSVRIRERLRAARRRYHANDNIADCIRPGELEQLLRAYRSRKAALANPSSADSDIFGEEGK